jgi:hypothetical protein
MVVIECPWCEGPAEVGEASVECAACAVSVELAGEEAELERIAA